jgi:hypothetical protein
LRPRRCRHQDGGDGSDRSDTPKEPNGAPDATARPSGAISGMLLFPLHEATSRLNEPTSLTDGTAATFHVNT